MNEFRSTSINSRKSKESHCSQSFKVFASGPSVLQAWQNWKSYVICSSLGKKTTQTIAQLFLLCPVDQSWNASLHFTRSWQLAQIFSRRSARVAVDLVLLAGLDGLTRGIVPKVAEAGQGQRHGVPGVSDIRWRVRRLVVSFATNWMFLDVWGWCFF